MLGLGATDLAHDLAPDLALDLAPPISHPDARSRTYEVAGSVFWPCQLFQNRRGALRRVPASSLMENQSGLKINQS